MAETREVFVNIRTNKIASIPLNGGGSEIDKLRSHPNVKIIKVTEQRAAHVDQNHCVYSDGNIVLLPEEDWPENQEIE
jgi:hypothetical protein